MEPDLMEVGSTLEEAKQLRREHDELLTKLNVSNTASRTPITFAHLKAGVLNPSGACWPKAVVQRVVTSSCRGHVDELATEPFLLLHREHGTGYRRSWNCCDRRTCFVVIWKHFCFILSTGTRIRIDSVMRPRSSSRGRNTSASVTVTVTV